jgi:DNA-binding response OmpR family regulator
MRQDSTQRDPIHVSLLNDDPVDLKATADFLAGAGFKVRPFSEAITFLEHAGIVHPPAAIVHFRGSNVDGLAVANWLRELSPDTLVVITLKVHDKKARGVLPRRELLDLIKSHAATNSRDFGFTERTKFREGEVNLGRCA